MNNSAKLENMSENLPVSEKPFTREMAYKFLVSHAEPQARTILRRGKSVTLRKNEVNFSTECLANEWLWKSRGKVTRFLRELADEGKIIFIPDRQGSLIMLKSVQPDVSQPEEKPDIPAIDRLPRNQGLSSSIIPPPTLEEVRKYCLENCLSVDADTFYQYYTVRNWKSSGNHPILNWKKSIEFWELNNHYNKAPVNNPEPFHFQKNTINPAGNFSQRDWSHEQSDEDIICQLALTWEKAGHPPLFAEDLEKAKKRFPVF